MGKSLSINVHHVTRVEGHGNIVIDMKNGVLRKAQLEIVEAPRFFEALLKGRNYQETAIITSRICGICSLGHQLTSLKATETALGIDVSPQTVLLRKILVHGATFQSNVLHALFLATPDYFNQPSVFALIPSRKEVVLAALRLKRLANDIGDIISGRAIHPVRCIPGGFTMLPETEELEILRDRLINNALPDARLAIEALKSTLNSIPEFERETEYISLKHPEEYALYDGEIYSSDTGKIPVENYLSVTNEFIVPHSTSKHTRHNRSSYMVGALARFNNNYDNLTEGAKEIAEILKLEHPCYNPYKITLAQMVEVFHCIEDSVILLNKLIDKGITEEKKDIKQTKYGRGIASTEVPRGILFHDYTYNRQGNIEAANCVIPTGQNLANIDDDMKKLVPEIAGYPKKKITHLLEMLVRAYDPCISCSVHLLDVNFIE